MTLTFPVEIVTPLGVVFEGEAEHVRAPGALGSFGVLANHTPFITPMTEGQIIVRSTEGEKTYLTSGGLADVSGGKVLILAEDARDPNEPVEDEE
jgi:F-type H+-transporting ATPase subunit epsilon